MVLHLQFRRYCLPLRAVVRTAHEVWTERQGIVLRLADGPEKTGYGEVAPIGAFDTESVDEAAAALATLGEWPTVEQLTAVPKRLGCLRSAITAALQLRHGQPTDSVRPSDAPATSGPVYRAIAALLPAGQPALAQLQARAEAGFRSFKWKVGVHDAAEEFGLLDDLCAELPKGGKLRLDANGAWDRRLAERWLERCAERPIEYIEQPCFAAKKQGATAWARAEDTLLGLAADYPTPLALDESLVGDTDLERWLGAGWPGWFVLKPALLGDVDDALRRLSAAHATVVFSSALETAVGARRGLELAFGWNGEAKALGFGVWPLFQDSRCDGPAAAPFIRAEDVSRIDPEAVWNALN